MFSLFSLNTDITAYFIVSLTGLAFYFNYLRKNT
nr:MAG TPA: hypothetical protein [Bacteriophage sp.]